MDSSELLYIKKKIKNNNKFPETEDVQEMYRNGNRIVSNEWKAKEKRDKYFMKVLCDSDKGITSSHHFSFFQSQIRFHQTNYQPMFNL